MIRALGLTLATLSSFASAQPGATIRSETRLVVVDAVVRDKHGRYVQDLTRSDFRVFEDNREQTVTSFEREGGPGEAPSKTTHLVLLFDDAHAGAAAQHYARDAAARLIDAGSGAGNQVAVVKYGGALTVTQNFTSEAPLLKAALNGSARRGEAGLISNFMTDSLLLALRNLARELGEIPGRKSIALLSPGFGLNAVRERELAAAIDACNRANVAVYPIDINGLSVDKSSGPRQPGIISTPSGRIPFSPGADAIATASNPSLSQQMLRALASGTGGFLVINTNDLPGALARIAKERSEYYLLGYTPAHEASPGTCHSLKVKVERSGVEVRSRSGYCDRKPLDLLAGNPVEREMEKRIAAEGTNSVPVQTSVFYISPNVARVHAVVDIPAEAFWIDKSGRGFRAETNILGVASSSDGTVAARFSDSAILDSRGKSYRYEKQFKIAPGRYVLKIVFGEGASFGRADTPLDVDPWDGTRLQLSSVVLGPAAPGGKPDDEADLLGEDRTPLVANGHEVLPAAANRFSHSDEVLVYAEAYGVGARSARVQLLDPKTNSVERELGVVPIDAPIEGRRGVPFGFALRMEPLARGLHRLSVIAFDANGASSGRTVDFKVQ